MHTFYSAASRVDSKGSLANYVVNFNGTVFAGPFPTRAEAVTKASQMNEAQGRAKPAGT